MGPLQNASYDMDTQHARMTHLRLRMIPGIPGTSLLTDIVRMYSSLPQQFSIYTWYDMN